MGTPLKALLSPRLLSPLSPRFLSVPKNQGKSINHAKRDTLSARRLEFSQYLSPTRLEPMKFVNNAVKKQTATRDFILNSPNKKNIFENGVTLNEGHTVLGVGTFGKVIRGIHKGKIVAIKVVKNPFPLNEKNALNLNHENIVRTIDIIQNPNGLFSLIIMEYFKNSKQLQAVLEDRNYDIEPKMLIFANDICNGIDFLHRKSILHLDIKPQNILVAENVCKICDFGNSVVLTELQNFTHQGTIIYTAPELLQGKRPTEKCDIYSFGIVLWQLKTRMPPYHDMDNVETVIYKVVKFNWRPKNMYAPDTYSKLYRSCWDTDPNKRPDTSRILSQLKKM